MAQVPATSYESISLGDVAEFTIPFPFLSRAEVFVTVDGASVPFTWINDGLVQLSAVPELGAVVRRYRSTAAYVPLHQFNTGVPFLPRYVDRDFKQTLYAVQESVNDTAGTAAQALVTAEESLVLVQDAFDILSERTQYIVLGPYGPGLNFQTTSQVFSYLGEFYAPGPALTLPYTTTGAGAGEITNFRSVGDAVLRSALAAPSGAELVGYGAGTVKDALDNVSSVVVTGTGLDQASELSTALASGKSVILRGAITLASPVTSTAASNFIFSESASITYTGTAGSTHVLKFTPSSALVIRGKLSIDCDNKAGIGLSCRALAAAKHIEIDGVTVIDCFQASPSTSGAHGIQVVNDSTGQPDFISVTGCVISGVSRSTGDIVGSVCSGITVCDGLTTIITGNKISSVSTGNGTVDADGISVFSDIVGSAYQRSNALIQSNTLSDCAGRFVKLQTRGKASVIDNLMSISNIVLEVAWRAIDSQIGDADIRNNKIEFTGAWSGGADMAVIQLQTQSTVDYTGQSSNQNVIGNIINVRASATRLLTGRAFMVILDNLATAAATASVDVADNQITYEGGIGSTTKACNIAFTVRCPNTFVSGATASVKLRGNSVSAANFMDNLGGAANANLTDKLVLQISENVLLSPDNIPLLPWVSGDRYTSSLLVYGNSVGLRGGEVMSPFDFSRIKPGCAFVLGASGAPYVNAPSSFQYSEVTHKGAFIQVDSGPDLRRSLYAPVPGAAITWTAYTL